MSSRVQTILLVLALLALAGWIVSKLIVTDEEAIENWADAAESAVMQQDADWLTRLLSPDFHYGQRDREQAVAYAIKVRRDFALTTLDITLTRIEVDGDTASADARIKTAGMGRPWIAETRLRFVELETGWVLDQAEPLRSPFE